MVNLLQWAAAGQDRRRSQPPRDIQRYPAFMGEAVPVVMPNELGRTAFTEGHLRGSRAVGYRSTSSLPIVVRDEIQAGERFVYAYYGGVDKIAHERGFGDFYDAELRTADRLVADLLDLLPAGVVLLVTADHGQVQVGDNIITPSAELLSLVTLQSGEGRFRWLHARRGARDDLYEAASAEFGDTAWVMRRDEIIAEGWFGASVPLPIANRLGDIAIVAREPVSYHDPLDGGPFELICRHGSMTSAEIFVPLVAGMRE